MTDLITIHASSFIFACGFLISIFFFWKMTRVEIIEEEKIFDFVLMFILGALIFGRAIYIFENSNDFQFKFDRAIHVYKYPGFNLWGVFIGGLTFSFSFARKIKMKKNRLFDFLAVSFSLFLSFVFLGYFFDGVYAGFITPVFGFYFRGFAGQRFPLQLPAALIFFLFFLNGFRKIGSVRPGIIFWFFLCTLFASLLVLELLRRDRVYFENVSVNKLLFFAAAMFCTVVIMLKYGKRKL